MTTTALPRRTPRSRRAPELLCDFCTWPAGYIAPESGALVCDPYAHPITDPGNTHPLLHVRDEHPAAAHDLTGQTWDSWEVPT